MRRCLLLLLRQLLLQLAFISCLFRRFHLRRSRALLEEIGAKYFKVGLLLLLRLIITQSRCCSVFDQNEEKNMKDKVTQSCLCLRTAKFQLLAKFVLKK